MTTKVLIIDDSKSSRQHIIDALRGAELFDDYCIANDGLEGFKLLTQTKIDLIICDLVMPKVDGLQFLKLVNSQPEPSDIPVIMLTSTDDLDSRLKSLEQGASDYLTKPFDAAELVARVKIHFKIKRLQDDLVSANKHFKQLSNIDPLTNLYNRRFFTEIIDAELQRTSRLKSFLSLLIVDIDRFKEINDSYGHQVGDEVLLAVADKLSEALRTYDIASRYGGDEFVIVLPNTQLLSGLEVAERIRKAVQSINFKVPLGKLSVTVSIGIAAFPTEKVDCYNALFTGADAALYRAKHNGRNRVEADEDGTTLDHQKATCSEDQT